MDMGSSSMDMGASSMDMAMTSTASAAMSTSTGMSGMGGMGMGRSSCKISMLWNWNTIDACFISSTWRIRSRGMFAGSCIGVICLVISLEFLRRAQRTYESYLIQNAKSLQVQAEQLEDNPSSSGSSGSNTVDKASPNVNSHPAPLAKFLPNRVPTSTHFRLTLPQQIIRALLHMVQFGVAYFIMLLAMYYNGYIIICILIGAFLGFFIFSWDTVRARRSAVFSFKYLPYPIIRPTIRKPNS